VDLENNFKKKYLYLIPFLLACLLASACGDASSTTSESTTSSTTTTTTQSDTFGSLAQLGKNVYLGNCAGCHGANGGGGVGPAVIGNTSFPQKYHNAGQLLSFIQTTMPFSNPGSLNLYEYQQILCYLMVENSYVDSQTVFDAGSLDQVPIS
jgi:cytochrome c